MNRTAGEKVFDVLNFFVLGLFALITFYPFYYIIIYSFSDPELAGKGIFLLPAGFSLINYNRIFQQSDIMHAAFISLARTFLGTLLAVSCCSMFAYGIIKEVLPLRKFMYRATILIMYISIGIIPVFITYKALGLRNNFLVYILPNLVAPFLIVLLKTYFEQLPLEIEESAMIDGAGYFRIFIQIILPLSKPILATVAIFHAVYLWNSYWDNLYFANSPKLMTLPLLLFTYLNQNMANAVTNRNALSSGRRVVKITPTSIRMTITVITTLPVLFVYPFLQRYFLKGLLIGSVKG